MKLIKIGVFTAVALIGTAAFGDGQKTVETLCAGCHATGALNAPRLQTPKDWEKRLEQGEKALVKNAIKGLNAMPPKGGNPGLSDKDIEEAVQYILAGLNAPAKTSNGSEGSEKTTKTNVAGNSFNRLMTKKAGTNLPPSEDGIHDPEHEDTYILQTPEEAFAAFAPSKSGNNVDWVASLSEGLINPRFDRFDPSKAPFVLDMNIIREVKGSMPNVLYPHKQHTEWLDCTNCHPKIFIPKKGANQMSMAGIIMGQQCGTCHGKVAFPISDCRKCHSQKKTQ